MLEVFGSLRSPCAPLLLLLFLAFAAPGCFSRNKIGDLFASGEGNPGDDGFGGGGLGDNTGSYLLYDLQAGMHFSGGGPTLEAIYPEDGATTVPVDALVALRFSESLNPDVTQLQKGVKLRVAPGGDKVPADYSLAPGSAGTVLVIVPAAPLEEETSFEVSITGALQDVQGEAFDPGEGNDAAVFTFTTGKATDPVTFQVIDALTLPAQGATEVFDGAPVLLFFSEGVDTSKGGKGLGGKSKNFTVTNAAGEILEGTRSFHYGDRLLVYTPHEPYLEGETITVTAAGGAGNGAGDETLGEDYTAAFTVLDFARVTAISFPATHPLVKLPGEAFQGVVNKKNRHAFDVDVMLQGKEDAVRLTLLFWDGGNHAVIEVEQGKISAGTHSFSVDLRPQQAQALADGTLIVGAYTTKTGVNAPVGPAGTLPRLLKDVKEPDLTALGPPSGPGVLPGLPSNHLLTEVPDPAIHGRASEDLASVKVWAEFLGSPLDPVKAITFFSMEYPAGSGQYSREVTRGEKNLFITEPVIDIGTGGVFPGLGGGRGSTPPVTVTKIRLEDLAGNTRTYEADLEGSLDFRGYFYSVPASPSAADVAVLCYDDTDFQALQDVDLVIEDLDDPALAPWTAYTGKEGTVSIDTLAPAPALGDHLLITAVKNGYRVLGIEWVHEGKDLLLSLPLAPEDPAGETYPLTVMVENATGQDLPHLYAGGTAVDTGGDDPFLASADPNPASMVLQAGRNRLQFVEVLAVETQGEEQYQWAWSNPFVMDTDGGVQDVAFRAAPEAPQFVQPMSFDDTSGGGGFTRAARVVALLPGIPGALPLGFDPGVDDTGPRYAFDIPVPSSLFTNEVIAEPLEDAAFDPPYELLIQPELGKAENDALPVDETLLEKSIRFEIERRGDSGDDPTLVRERLPYDSGTFGTEQTPDLPAELADPSVAGEEVTWDNVLKAFQANDFQIGAFRVSQETPSGDRHWTVLVSYAATQGADTVSFTFPDLSAYGNLSGLSNKNGTAFEGFSAPGDYPVWVEAYHVQGFDLSNTLFSELEKRWETYWRSGRVTLTRRWGGGD